jgi:5-methylcytosine-specific restriction endonuclease McrA
MSAEAATPQASRLKTARNRWSRTKAEWEELARRAIELRKEGVSHAEIASRLGVSTASVVAWVGPSQKTQGRKRSRTRRQCLKCDRRFFSAGAWNRLCSECRECAKTTSPLAEGASL